MNASRNLDTAPGRIPAPALLFAALLCALLAVAAPAAADRPVDETRAVDAGARISIETLSGEVTVTGWNRDEVHVTGTVGDDTRGLKITGGGGTLEIEVDIPEGRHEGKRDLDVHLQISVPAGARLEVESVSTSTAVTGVSGPVDVESVSGGVEIDGTPESVSAETVSGGIKVTGSRGRVHAESVSGSVEIDGGSGEVHAGTVSGRVMVDVGTVESGRLETVSGEVTFSGALAPGGDLGVEAHSGRVVVALPAGTSARFRVETFSGGIDNELSADEPRKTSQYTPGKELEFTLGAGDGEVRIESFSGQVTLRPQ
jgi:DUF4097 and DUF4098 domain-containing protein YvlB